ncbi:MAG: DUF4062 domain-containing protein [bacterium]|nr:DUF4062 domain-containing protein [bacterium]
MSFQATVYNVMIASPSDVAAERNIIREVIYEWNGIHAEKTQSILRPVGWETNSYPAMGDEPQALINKQILNGCDLLVGVFWTRIGTSTANYASGTIEEIEEHIKANKPAMLYFSGAPVHPDSVDPEQYSALKNFKESCQSRGLYETYEDKSTFRDKFFRQLQLMINNDPNFAVTRELKQSTSPHVKSTIPDIPDLSNEAKNLLIEAALDGDILRLYTMDGLTVQTNNKNFVDDKSPRTRAVWEGVIKELEILQLIESTGAKKEIYHVTRKGYEMVELIKP